MIFTSPRFLLFLVVLLAALCLPLSREAKKRILAFASCLFYAAWDWRYLGLLLAVGLTGQVSALGMGGVAASRRRRGAWLWACVAADLGILSYFKYCNFFVENLNRLVGSGLPALEILLPAGISFYTFKTMSYAIDVYRGELEPCRSWLDYVTFMTFFPELIAGPIVRGSVFLPQMQREIGPTRERMLLGGSLFVQGVVKKLLIADRLALVANPIFAEPELYSPVTVWCGVLAYTLQIYCDFSGYSDMAIGTARMIGYDLPENFAMPYSSTSITEFWRRWHITLSTWLRDYLYIPLGGNRRGGFATSRNLLITMLIGGLWHGASWNFVIWGGAHGGALMAHRLWSRSRRGKAALPGGLAWAATFLFVSASWVLFRAGSLDNALALYRKMVWLGEAGGGLWLPEWLGWCAGLVLIGHLAGWQVERTASTGKDSPAWSWLKRVTGMTAETSPISGVILYPARATVGGAYGITLLLLLIVYFAPMNTNPFIYFQF